MKQQLVTLLLGEAQKPISGELFKAPPTKSAPAYSELSIPRQVVIGQELADINGRVVPFILKSYQPDVLLIQCTIDVENIFHKEIFTLEEQIFAHANRILEEHGGSSGFTETYSIFVVSGYDTDPEQFLSHGAIIASLLKSERLELDPNEIKYTLDASLKYAKNDLSIIDWDGAFLFDPIGDVDEEIEILTLANLQLLRHRILDRTLDQRLARIASMIPTRRKLFTSRELDEDLRKVIKVRMTSIAELQRLDREIKMIGDWYSARFYNLAGTKFRIEDWRKSINTKLDSLEDAYSVVVENFTVSGKHRAEWAQIIVFFFLQIGWLTLIILEFLQFMRHK